MFSDEKCSTSVLEPSIKILKLEGLMPSDNALSDPCSYDTIRLHNCAYNTYDKYSEDSLLNDLPSVIRNQKLVSQSFFFLC